MRNSPDRAPFIAFEGLDGSGKSTLITSLTGELTRRSVDYVLTREPGGTPLAEEIRHILLRKGDEVPDARTEVLLYEASRAQHVAKVIKPALDAKKWVLCDRFFGSTVSFQCFARGLERKDVDWLNLYATGGLKPDFTVLLDLPATESLKRIALRNQKTGELQDRMESEKINFHENVRQGYLTQAKEAPAEWLVLDATGTRESLFEQLLSELESRKLLGQ
jgi:dTMP kinase